MRPGSAFTFAGLDGLWIIISDPAIDSLRILVTRISDLTGAEPAGLYLEPTDHSAIKSRCWVDLAEAQEVSAASLERSAADGTIIWQDDCKPSVIQRVWRDVTHSKRLPREFVAL